MDLISIIGVLQATLALLTLVSGNPAATVEQKQQAVQTSINAISFASAALNQSSLAQVQPPAVDAPIGIPSAPGSLSQPSTQSSTRVESTELVITPSPQKGSLFGKLYDVQVRGENLVLDAVVVAIKDQADREKFYPGIGVMVKTGKGVVARLGAKECIAVKPSYACPGKDIETAEQREAASEIGYHNRDAFTLIQGESYQFEVPESARLIYVKGTTRQTGQVIEKEL